MALLKVALTGGVAEGKTTVLRFLAEEGLRTASADDVAREVFEDPVVQSEIGQRLKLDGPIEREKVRLAIEGDPSKRRALNEVMHPEILARLISLNADVVEVPLLIETCIQSLFERVWVATCGPEEQERRLVERLGDAGAARRLVASQLPTVVKCAFADQAIRTDQPLSSVQKAAGELARNSALR
jgi:dephospho-CoA kinase